MWQEARCGIRELESLLVRQPSLPPLSPLPSREHTFQKQLQGAPSPPPPLSSLFPMNKCHKPHNSGGGNLWQREDPTTASPWS